MDPLSLVLQAQPPMAPDAFPRVFETWTRTAGTFLGTLIVGGLLLALAPDFVEGVIDTVEDELGSSLLWGVGIFVGLIVVTVILVFTLIGIIVAIPLLIAMAILYLAGSAIVFVLVGERILDAADVETSRWGHLIVGSLVATVVAALPLLGGLVNFVVNAVGVGAIAYRWRRG